MAKPNNNYLVGLIRQLDEARSGGTEEWYAFGELLGAALEDVGWLDVLEDPLGPDTADVAGDEPDPRQQSLPGLGGPAQGSGPSIAPASGLASMLASVPREELERVLRGALGQSVRGLKVPVPKAVPDGT